MLLQDSGFKRGEIERLGTNSKQPGESLPLGRHPGWDVGPGMQGTCEVELPARRPSPAGAVNSDNWERRKGGRSAQCWDLE